MIAFLLFTTLLALTNGQTTGFAMRSQCQYRTSGKINNYQNRRVALPSTNDLIFVQGSDHVISGTRTSNGYLQSVTMDDLQGNVTTLDVNQCWGGNFPRVGRFNKRYIFDTVEFLQYSVDVHCVRKSRIVTDTNIRMELFIHNDNDIEVDSPSDPFTYYDALAHVQSIDGTTGLCLDNINVNDLRTHIDDTRYVESTTV